MDTSSLVNDMKTDDFYKDIAGDIKPKFDNGLMKDKLDGRIMTEFVALRLKLSTYKMLGGSGDKKCTMKETLDFEDYKQCLLAGENSFKKQLLLENKLHEVGTIEVKKLSFSRDDDKQVVLSDDMSTLA